MARARDVTARHGSVVGMLVFTACGEVSRQDCALRTVRVGTPYKQLASASLR